MTLLLGHEHAPPRTPPVPVEVLPDDFVLPEAVRQPRVVRVIEEPHLQSLRVKFADGGVWSLSIRELAFLQPQNIGNPQDLGALFAASPRVFAFQKRVKA